MNTILRLSTICLAFYGVSLAALFYFQRSLLFMPPPNEASPASVGLPQVEVVHLQTEGGQRLLAWYVAPSSGKPLILYFHGNASGLGETAPRFQALTATGYGLLGVEYEGYAGSTGSPSEEALLRDGEAAYAKAIALGIPASRIVAMGESLGSGVAVDLASRHPVAALVLDSPYSSTVDVAAARYWMFPVRFLMRDQFRSDLKIGNVAAPVLIVHGALDRTIPIRFGERLFALANQPKDFVRVDGAGHLAMSLVIPKALDWIDRALAGAGS